MWWAMHLASGARQHRANVLRREAEHAVLFAAGEWFLAKAETPLLYERMSVKLEKAIEAWLVTA